MYISFFVFNDFYMLLIYAQNCSKYIYKKIYNYIKVGTRVTEICSTVVNTCVDDNAECNGTICNCLPKYVWNGTHCGNVVYLLNTMVYLCALCALRKALYPVVIGTY